MTTRPDFSPPWAGRMHLTQVTLNRLSRQQIAELIRRKSGIVVLPPSLVDQIVDRTDGVPLFVEEFTRMVARGRASSATARSRASCRCR